MGDDPFNQWRNLWGLSRAYLVMRRYEEALTASKKVVQIRPAYGPAYVNLTACYAVLGREEEARAAAAELLRLNPKFSLEREEKRLAGMMDQATKERYIAALRKAGLPD